MPLALTDPVPFEEALASQRVKSVVGTKMRTAEIQRWPVEIRERARFSAAMTSVEYLQVIDDGILSILSGAGDTASAALTMAEELARIGYAPVPGSEGSLTDHASFRRRKLILSTNVSQAGNYGQWAQHQTDGAVGMYPAWELYRAIWPKGAARDWRRKWVQAGGRLRQGRMIARKDDPIWTRSVEEGGFNRFGTPYPPFDFNSGMRLRPVDRVSAVDAGVIDPDEDAVPQSRGFTEDLQAAPEVREKRLAEALLEVLRENFGERVGMRQGVAHLQGPRDWRSHGLPSAATWADLPAAPKRIAPQEARLRLEQAQQITDPFGRQVTFDERALAHWLERDKPAADIEGRLRLLPLAEQAVRSPREVWEQRGQTAYVSAFRRGGEGADGRGVVVFVYPDDRVETYFVNQLRWLDNVRKGFRLRRPGDA